MKRSTADYHWQTEQYVKRVWEALRRNKEFRDDCRAAGDSRKNDEKVTVASRNLNEKWAVECNDYDLTYEEIKARIPSIRSQIRGQQPEMVEAVYPDVPDCFRLLVARLLGASGTIDLIVRCHEYEEMHKRLRDKAGVTYHDIGADQWIKLLDNWVSPNRIHFDVDVDADPFEVANRVTSYLCVLHDVRALRGFSQPYKKRTIQKLEAFSRNSPSSFPKDKERKVFARDVEVFRVWDLRQQHLTDTQIAKQLWPREFKIQGKARNSTTGDKGPLCQRVHDCMRLAEEWIERLPARIKHPRHIC